MSRFGLVPRITSPIAVLRALGAGFAFVVLLLAVVGFIALQKVAALRASADQLVDEQLLMARLLHEVQGEEKALTEALHRATRLPSSINRSELLAELDRTDAVFERLTKESAQTPEARVWSELLVSANRFTSEMRRVLRGSARVAREELEQLLSLHNHVVQLSHQLLTASTSHLKDADRLIEVQSRDLTLELYLVLGTSVLLASACAAGTLIYARHSIHQIETQSDELDKVSWHMLQSQEVTARRFSHELHDELGQSLAAIKANLTLHSPPADPQQHRADCVRLVDSAIQNVRSLAQLLRPVILDDFGLAAGLRWLAEGFQTRTRIQVHFESTLEERLHTDTETHLFRITQEALTNVARHSGASNVQLSLHREGPQVRLHIQDDGKGISKEIEPPSEQPSVPSLGLVGMRARARECGGKLTLESNPLSSSGLKIVVQVPARPPEET